VCEDEAPKLLCVTTCTYFEGKKTADCSKSPVCDFSPIDTVELATCYPAQFKNFLTDIDFTTLEGVN